jgi:hypothetical protein
MKRSFFVLLFTLTTLVSAGCSSDDSSDASFPSAESSIAFPTPGAASFAPDNFTTSGRVITYGVSAKDYNNHFDRLAEPSSGWTCNIASYSPYIRVCRKTEGNITHYAEFRIVDREPQITLSVYNNAQSPSLPKTALFKEFGITGTKLYDAYEVTYDFGSSTNGTLIAWDDFNGYYIEKLVKRGFKEEEKDPSVTVNYDVKFKKESVDKVYEYGVEFTYTESPNYTVIIYAYVQLQQQQQQ